MIVRPVHPTISGYVDSCIFSEKFLNQEAALCQKQPSARYAPSITTQWGCSWARWSPSLDQPNSLNMRRGSDRIRLRKNVLRLQYEVYIDYQNTKPHFAFSQGLTVLEDTSKPEPRTGDLAASVPSSHPLNMGTTIWGPCQPVRRLNMKAV